MIFRIFAIFNKILKFDVFIDFGGFQALGPFFLNRGGQTFFEKTFFHQNPTIFWIFVFLFVIFDVFWWFSIIFIIKIKFFIPQTYLLMVPNHLGKGSLDCW